MATHVLLLDEGTALAFVGIVAILAVCLLSVALVAVVLVVVRKNEGTQPIVSGAPAGIPTPAPPSLTRASRTRTPTAAIRNVEIDVPTRHADAIIHALQSSGWSVHETGEVVATDEDEEGLTTIKVDAPGPRPGTGEEIR